MRITESCAECLYGKQENLSDNPDFLSEIKGLLDSRKDTDTSPYMVYQFNRVYERYFGKKSPFGAIKKQYNDLVLSMKDSIQDKIESAPDPLAAALCFARIGNYIDFGAMNHVDETTFLSLFDNARLSSRDETTYRSFLLQCETAHSFLLIADNCGEIVLDKLFLEQLRKRFPQLSVAVLVRGAEVLNDATLEDAEYVGLNQVAALCSNGLPLAGTVLSMLPDDALALVEHADVILAKGQGNYESLCGQGLHVFYSFLCKCDLFTSRFQVPALTGMFVEEELNQDQAFA